jgi:hypothetical protein
LKVWNTTQVATPAAMNATVTANTVASLAASGTQFGTGSASLTSPRPAARSFQISSPA